MENNVIRVAHIIGKWHGGGVESVVMNYYQHIDRNIIQFDFICDSDSTCIPYEKIERLGGKIILVPPYQKLISYIKNLKHVFRNGNYRIVHSHLNTLSVFPLYAAKKSGVPIRIAHSHSTSNKKEWKKNIIKNILRPLSKLYSTDYLCCSELAGRYLFGNKYYNSGKVFLLKNAIDCSLFYYNENIRNIKRTELGFSEHTLVLGHIGRFVDQKNHVFLLEIFHELLKIYPDSYLLLIGKGPLEHVVKEKAKSLNIDNRIVFHGQTDDVSKYYNAFDAFVLPSLYEGLGLVLIESQCSGLPSFCSTEVPEEARVSDRLNYYSLLQRPDEWAKGIFYYVKHTKRTDAHLYLAEKGYDIEKESKKLEKFYLDKTNCI